MYSMLHLGKEENQPVDGLQSDCYGLNWLRTVEKNKECGGRTWAAMSLFWLLSFF